MSARPAHASANVWIELRRLLVGLDRASVRLRRQLIPEVAATKVEVVRLGASRVPGRQGRQPLRREAQSNLSGDCRAQLALEFEHASRLAVIGLGPYLHLVTRANQLRRHAQPAALGPHRPFHQILDAQLLTDLRERLRRALVAPGRCPPLHAEMLGIDLAERRTGFFGQTVRQILALRTPEVFEGQDGDRDSRHRHVGAQPVHTTTPTTMTAARLMPTGPASMSASVFGRVLADRLARRDDVVAPRPQCTVSERQFLSARRTGERSTDSHFSGSSG